MQNSSSYLIDNFPIPIREAMYALSEYYNTDYDYEEKDLYFALLNLKEWLEKRKWGESIPPKIFRIAHVNDEILKSIEKWKRACTIDIMEFPEVKNDYDKPKVKSKKLEFHGKIT